MDDGTRLSRSVVALSVRRDRLFDQLQITARHERFPPRNGTTGLIAEGPSRIRPILVDTVLTEERNGNLLLRCTSKPAIERLKDTSEPRAPGCRRIKPRSQAAVSCQIGKRPEGADLRGQALQSWHGDDCDRCGGGFDRAAQIELQLPTRLREQNMVVPIGFSENADSAGKVLERDRCR